MERVDIKVGFYCNNRCKFCVQGGKRDFLPAKSKDEINSSLKEAFRQGKREVVFTGGEPTLHPNFFEIVKKARDIGFKQIQIQSNGRIFSYLDFCIKAIKAGANQFGPSLHGHNAKIHDFLTEAKGSFNQTVRGIKNLKKLNQQILTNSVINKKNYKYLPELARLLIELGVDQFQFAFIHILGTAEKNKDWIVPKKSEAMPYLKKAIDIGVAAKKTVMTEAMPFCLMRGYDKYVAERIMPITSVYDADFFLDDYGQYRASEGKIKRDDCKKCKYYKECEGPWKEYVAIYGWKEFKPVRK